MLKHLKWARLFHILGRSCKWCHSALSTSSKDRKDFLSPSLSWQSCKQSDHIQNLLKSTWSLGIARAAPRGTRHPSQLWSRHRGGWRWRKNPSHPFPLLDCLSWLFSTQCVHQEILYWKVYYFKMWNWFSASFFFKYLLWGLLIRWEENEDELFLRAAFSNVIFK